MALSLYDVGVATYLQTLGAVAGFLEKGEAHCRANGIALDDMIQTRLYADMAPFTFQIVSVAHHSLGAIRAIQTGEFKPPSVPSGIDYAGLQKLIAGTRDELTGLSREEVEALEGRDVVFALGDVKLPFLAQDFVLSFSLPNFFFHATTAYDLLRMKGVPLGKRDFMGALRLKR